MERRNGTGFIQALKKSVHRYPDKTAITFRERHESYQILLTHVNQLSNALVRLGVRKGDCVAVISRNCMEYLETEFALYQIGAVVLKINWRMTAPEISYILQKNHAVLAFKGMNLMASTAELRRKNPTVRLIDFPTEGEAEGEFLRFYQNEAADFPEQEIDDTTPAMIVHTSGTTGRPKFLSYTHGDLLEKLQISLKALPFTSQTRFLLIEQLFHIACMRAYMCIGAGGTLTLISQFEPESYLRTLEKERITSAGMIPAVLKQILNHPNLDKYNISSLENVNYSTCAMPSSLIQQAIETLQCEFYQVYGMTEMLGLVTVLAPKEHLSGHISSVGKAVGGYEVDICKNEPDTGYPDGAGEVLIRGPVMMHGYLNNAELSKKVLTDGWYHTKDIGFVDNAGYLHICGRKDDLIISGGENIYPQEVVNVLEELSDDIADAAVYGLPDSVWGQKVWASIVLRPGSYLTVQQLHQYCKNNLANYKVPKGFDFRSSLPKNATGKTKVKELAEEVALKQIE